MAHQNDPFLALSLLTRLPIKLSEEDYTRSADAAWAYPLVGLVTGLIASAAAGLALWLGLPLWAASIFAIGAGMIVTGAMHEDGLADCADGFWGGWDPAMRLKIMRDSQAGTYGILALLGTQALRFGAVLAILGQDDWALTLIAVHVAARATMPMIMASLPHARSDGLSKSVGQVTLQSAGIAAAIGTIALLLGFGAGGVWLAIFAALTTLAVATTAKAKIGGQTGDVCGAAQQVTEIALLLAICA